MSEFVSFIGESFANYDDSVKVMLRIRPPMFEEQEDLNYFEIVSGQQLNVRVPADSYTYKNMKRTTNENSFNFEFSHIFDWSAGQEKVFSGVISSVVLDFLSGRNSLLFTYGITNSGKTYTLIGKPSDTGVLPRTIDYVFSCLKKYEIGTQPLYKPCPNKNVVHADEKRIAQDIEIKNYLMNDYLNILNKSNNFANCTRIFDDKVPDTTDQNDSFECSEISPQMVEQINLGIDVLDIPDGANTTHYIYMSIAEIYNENIYDLLDPNQDNDSLKEYARPKLKIQGDPKSGFSVKGLKNVLVCNSLEALKLLQIGLSNRRMAATRMNINSSRSHVIYSLRMVRCTELPNKQIATKTNEICFVDLAGAERQGSTLSQGERLKEASNINKSLLFLGRCIQEMRQYRLNINKNIVVSYRESKLTRLLQPFFVGRTSMILLVNISPSRRVFDETVNVLKFSALTKEALNRPLGVELQQAARADAMINDSYCLNLETFPKSELIEIIYNLRQKVLEKNKSIESHNSLYRQDMCQFTMDMVNEIEFEKEKQINEQRKALTELYLGKIEILKEEIDNLRKELTETNNKKFEEGNYLQQLDELKKEVETKKQQINQLLSDVEMFKIDSRDEINQLNILNKNMKIELEQKDDKIKNLEAQISAINKQMESQNRTINFTHKQITENLISKEKLIDSIECTFKKYREKSTEKQAKMVSKINEILNISNNYRKDFNVLKENFTLNQSLLTDKLHLVSAISEQKEKMRNNLEDQFRRLKNHFNRLNAKNSLLQQIEICKRTKTELNTLRDLFNHTSFKDAISRIEITFQSRLALSDENLANTQSELKIAKENCAEMRSKLAQNLAENNSNIDRIKHQEGTISSLRTNIKELECKQDSVLKELENMKPKLSEYDSLIVSKTASNNKIYAYEKEILTYKQLNDEYLQHIAKLEDLITQRHILAAAPQEKLQSTKRSLKEDKKENTPNKLPKI